MASVTAIGTVAQRPPSSGALAPELRTIEQQVWRMRRWAETRGHILNKKNVCLWILIAFVPFVLLRLAFSYASPFPYFSSTVKESDLVAELEFQAPESGTALLPEARPSSLHHFNSSADQLSSDHQTHKPPSNENQSPPSSENQNPSKEDQYPPSREDQNPASGEDHTPPLSRDDQILTSSKEDQNSPSREDQKPSLKEHQNPPSKDEQKPPSKEDENLPSTEDYRPPSKQEQSPLSSEEKHIETHISVNASSQLPPVVTEEPSRAKPVEDETLGLPEDNDKKDAEEWQPPPSKQEVNETATSVVNATTMETLGLPEDNYKKDAEEWRPPPSNQEVNETTTIVVNSSTLEPAETSQECNLYDGEWIHDPVGPLYTNETCAYIQGHQNCLRNGRPDKGYLYYRWKPRQCELPRFDGKAFLTKLWGKAIGFVGDSLSRNQMQSLLCMLWQVEVPDMIYQSALDRNVRWLFKEHQVVLATLWSPYLLKETEEELEAFPDLPKGASKLFSDTLDDNWTSVMNDFDILVFSTGQWFLKPSLYIEKNEIIGCHYLPQHNFTEIGFFHAYQKAIRGVLEKVSREFKGLTVLGTFSLDHFENGLWNTQGTCKREKPMTVEEKPLVGLDSDMHQVVVDEYNRMVEINKNVTTMGKLELLDVTYLSLLRADGHPGPYRFKNPYEGKAPGTYVQNDCLHWCLPGPIDTWNQFLANIVSPHLQAL